MKRMLIVLLAATIGGFIGATVGGRACPHDAFRDAQLVEIQWMLERIAEVGK